GSMISSFSSTISRPPSTRVPNTRTLSPMPISPRSSTRTGRRMSREVCVWSRSSTTPSSTSLRPPSSPGPWTDPRQQPAASLSRCDSGGEVEDLALRLGAGQRLIVHFVPHSGEDSRANVVVPGLAEPIGHVKGAFAVVGHRVLLTGEDEHRQLCADGRVPGSVIGLVVDVDETLHESCAHRGAAIVERIATVVGVHVLVRSDPGGGTGRRTAPVEEAVEELIDELLRRRFGSVVTGGRSLEVFSVDSSLDSAHLRGDPAQDESRQIADGPGSHDPRDHRPPAVSEHDAGKIRKDLTDLPLQSQLIG